MKTYRIGYRRPLGFLDRVLGSKTVDKILPNASTIVVELSDDQYDEGTQILARLQRWASKIEKLNSHAHRFFIESRE